MQQKKIRLINGVKIDYFTKKTLYKSLELLISKQDKQ